MKSFDITLKRECIYIDFRGQPGPCPRCGGKLRQRTQTYLVAAREGKRMADSFMLGSDFGWFCEACPTVVIDARQLDEMLSFSQPGWRAGSEFAVLGLVNLDAVPENKRDLPLGDDDNPVPLIEFKTQNETTQPAPEIPDSQRRRSRRK